MRYHLADDLAGHDLVFIAGRLEGASGAALEQIVAIAVVVAAPHRGQALPQADVEQASIQSLGQLGLVDLQGGRAGGRLSVALRVAGGDGQGGRGSAPREDVEHGVGSRGRTGRRVGAGSGTTEPVLAPEPLFERQAER